MVVGMLLLLEDSFCLGRFFAFVSDFGFPSEDNVATEFDDGIVAGEFFLLLLVVFGLAS